MLAAMPAHGQLIYRVAPSSAIHISGTSTVSDWVVKSQNVSGEMVFTPSGEKATGHPRGGGAIKDAPPSAMFGQIVTGDDIVVELDLLFGK